MLLTFLIADVRGYTRFTAQHGDEAAAKLAGRFAEICEGLVGLHDGQVIELRGDEALVVFSSARQSFRAAVALQKAFREASEGESLPLNVGVGLDAGEAIPVGDGYRGGALNLAARLCSIAGAGEILASEAVVHLARKTEGLVFVDRGEVRLKGLSSPIRVLQIGSEGELPDELPPLQPILVTQPTNLPDEPTPFIGREDEISRITALFHDPQVRLVTLTGPGGTGKTRLALQVGNSLLHDFPDGVFFVSLASLSDPALVPSAIAEVTSVKAVAGKELTETIVEALREKQILLVVDNFEHVLDAAEVVSRLLDACRLLCILTTSRIPLHLAREREHAVPPLSVPDPSHLPPSGSLNQYESVALFIDRAKAAKDNFAVTDENAPAVAEICYRLDGLPLALELAAARIKLFPPQALLQRLSSRLKLLTGGPRDRPTRQQTLRGAIDWSYSLLGEEEQTLFVRLSVFAGGCTFEAAEAVCNKDGDVDLLEGTGSLVDKSLIRQEGEEEPRFSMLETIREYASEKLAERGEEEAIRSAHASYFVDLAQEADPELRGPKQVDWFRRLDPEIPNIRTAIDRLLSAGQPEDVLRLVSALLDYWLLRRLSEQASEWLEEALSASGDDVSPAVRGKALWALGASLGWWWWGTERARTAVPHLEAALPLLRESGETLVEGRALLALGNAFTEPGEYERAIEGYEEGLAVFREIGYTRGIAVALHNLGVLAGRQGNESLALQRCEETIPLLRSVGDVSTLAGALQDAGNFALARHELDRASSYLEECLRLWEEIGRRAGTAHVLTSLAILAIKQGEIELARQLLHNAMVIVCELEDVQLIVAALWPVSALALASGNREQAGRLLGAAHALSAQWGILLSEVCLGLSSELERTEQRVRHALGSEDWERTQAQGAAMSFKEALAEAVAATAPAL